MLAIPAMVNVARIDSHITEGRFEPPEGVPNALHDMADKLVTYVDASRLLRQS